MPNENFDIDVEELHELINSDKKINLLDVREEYEFEEDNLNGLLIPLGELPKRLSEIESWKGQDIYIHCRSGARSDRAKQYLMAEGFTNVHNVLGGIMAYREFIG
ncbi:MAG: rhodanese-like domain-containing protein [Leadbetterella sp.]